ncbi:MAG: ABC transporter ATP-binding protein, partial [Fischerella sp.]|nr:ABC transporter ATP-binding protein [Fischerella sp.]
MHLRVSKPIRNLIKSLVKTTNFWQENYLILQEFKHFRKIAILAVVFSFLAATFEGVSIGFLLSFLQSLTNPNAQPKIGIAWLDAWITNTPSINPLYLISVLILVSTW